MTWGRRKVLVGFTLQGYLTEKQYLKIRERLYKIAERAGLGQDEWIDFEGRV